jgi:hypothetical protein
MPVSSPEAEVLDPEADDVGLELASRLRNPQTPITIQELALLRGKAVEVIEARITVLETARKRGIRMTSPEDWVLFKSPDDRVTGYLQDAGCERIRDILSIEIFNVCKPEKITASDGQSFMYIIQGDGRSKITTQETESVEGGRQSTDDFCKDKTGVALDLAVRKAARSNLNGRIVRELAGLKTVPLEELKEAWLGTNKSWEHCRKGRGFGTGVERAGGASEKEPQVEPPKCGVCGATAVFRSNSRGGFYGCPDYRKHEARKWSIDAQKWVAEVSARQQQKPDTTTTDAPAEQPNAARQAPQQPANTMTAGDIFGNQDPPPQSRSRR